MNLHFLGDALDHWKGSLLRPLRSEGLLTGLAADPMASDAPDWTNADWQLFAKLLRLNPHQILRHAAPLRTKRLDYFLEINHPFDLFLDPDTGIASGHVAKPWQYLRPAELRLLLEAQPSRVLAVYQHIRAAHTRERLERIVSAISGDVGPFSCCSYESSTVAMVFFTRSRSRIQAIHKYHAGLLGRHAPNRTCVWWWVPT